MKEKEKTSPYPILSVKERKGQSREYLNSSPILGEVGRGNGLSKRETGRRAFTLVELIIVITILAILATIAFISFQGYTSKSRDANRASTAKNIETGLGVFQAKSGVYPIQSTGGTISLSGTKITVQGNLDESIARVINLNEVPRDPKTGEMYHYISDTAGRGGKVLYYLENTPDYAFLTQSFAESEARTPIVKGEGPGVLLDMDLQMIQTGTGVDLFGAQSGITYTILVKDDIKIRGTGLGLGGGFQNFAEKGGRLEAPKSCPTGFIPVPGNAEFLQPGFCVMKYEASYEEEGLAFGDTTRNTVGSGTVHPECTISNTNTSYTGGENCTPGDFEGFHGGIVSKSGKFPIAYLTQHEAMQACKSMGGTTHLITNNEWMTIARNIEANTVNWSGGVVGVNHISNGISNSLLGCGTGNTKDIYSGSLLLTNRWASKSGPGGKDCDTRRQLQLSNSETLWDLAGNIREHVNGRNTGDGIFYTTLQGDVCGGTSEYNWSGSGVCNFVNGYSYSKFGPKTPSLNDSFGIGKINSNSNGSIFIRGGSASNVLVTGIYAMSLNRDSTKEGYHVGFRCAY